jgi:hypothetical protein
MHEKMLKKKNYIEYEFIFYFYILWNSKCFD